MGLVYTKCSVKCLIFFFLHENAAAFRSCALVPLDQPLTGTFTCTGAWVMENRNREGLNAGKRS